MGKLKVKKYIDLLELGTKYTLQFHPGIDVMELVLEQGITEEAEEALAIINSKIMNKGTDY